MTCTAMCNALCIALCFALNYTVVVSEKTTSNKDHSGEEPGGQLLTPTLVSTFGSEKVSVIAASNVEIRNVI